MGGIAGETAAGGMSGAAGGGAAGAAGSGYEPCPSTGPCKIMPFGDSITEGFPGGGGYRVELFRLANQDDHDITFVGSLVNGPMNVDNVMFPRNHEGHGGWTIDDEPARNTSGLLPIATARMQSYTPHIVTLMIGTNDINGNIDVGTAPDRLERLLDTIFAVDPDVLLILAQIVPTRTDGTNNTVRTYNAAMPDIVAGQVAQGRHVVLVDMYEAFTRDSNYKNTLLGDNLHPNDAGYARIGETWYAAIEPYLR
jgi:lysophospholipase L1-like esterase